MHYIRFFKLPTLEKTEEGFEGTIVKATVTVTTDLGEYPLREDINLYVEYKSPRLGLCRQGYKWKGRDGMRSLDIKLHIPHQNPPQNLTMFVSPDECMSLDHLETLFLGDGGVSSIGGEGIIFPAACPFNSSERLPAEWKIAQRPFSIAGNRMYIWEETGETIEGHLWDAGLMLSAYLASISPANENPGVPKVAQYLPQLPTLERQLSRPDLNIIELGAGCGLVSITLSALYHQNISSILLTDLPNATPIIERNLRAHSFLLKSYDVPYKCGHQVLNWAEPLPSNVQETKWDLVVLSDCTYNQDVARHLVQTLKRLEGALVLLAMKIRNDSELVFFDLMKRLDLW
ncbi:UPF0665 family protein [Lachnellula suecica]|uniref:UPF0665 family protein n=1 Tax=Lachnellula suecica TaxID=602035 RepID=A0A8T9CB63_9HELO|nr:UPF0665 family protein [Lachnellula suecica]